MSSKGDLRLGPLLLAVLFVCQAAQGQESLKDRIRGAVERGRAHLLGRLPALVKRPPVSYPMGHVALALSAVLRAGASIDDPPVRGALAWLEGQPVRETYSAACYLMALDALAQAQEREARRAAGTSGTSARAGPARASGPVRTRMEEVLKWLIAARNRGQGSWHYTGPGSHDNSNTQFAVLGLQIGLEHHLAIPREVFLEISRHFAQSAAHERDEIEFTIAYHPGIKALLKKDAGAPVRLRAPTAGWGYTANERIAYASMTAAGASSLLVARAGLGSLDRAAEAALLCSLAWITVHLDDYFTVGREHSFYTLYSLEKVGDLGDIHLFNERDWYDEGASRILALQREDGGWRNLVDTSFALLFLTRATRPQLRALPAPRVVTRVGGADKPASDQVYLESLDGYVSAFEFLSFLEEGPDRDLLKVGEQVVRNYPLARQGELVPSLLKLLRRSETAGFARKSLAEVTGLTARDPEVWRRWHGEYLELVALGAREDPDPEAVLALLSRSEGLRLKTRLLDLVVKRRLVAACPALIGELSSDDSGYRRRVTEVLEHLTGQRFAPAQGAGAKQEAAEWQAFWQENGGRILRAARIRAQIAALEAASGSGAERAAKAGAAGADPEKALAALVAEGSPAVPYLLEAMKAREYPVELVLALEWITSRRLGLRPAAWSDWWETEGKSRPERP